MTTTREPMKVSFENGCLTICPQGEIDHHSARAMREEIDRHLYEYRPSHFTLSLSQIRFMDSSGLGLILGRLAVCRHFSCPMRLCGAGERMLKIFRMAGLYRMQDLEIDGLQKEEQYEKTAK